MSLQKDTNFDTSRIMIISDLHIPAHHKDAFKFLEYVRDMLEPTLVLSIGDILDNQSLSFFEGNPNLPGALDELILARKSIQKLYELFPNLVIVKGNHDYRPERIAKKAGLPSEYIQDMPTLLNSPKGWIWKSKLYLTLPTGEKCFVAHDVGRGLKKAVSSHSMNIVGGHYHSKFKITYVSTHSSLSWGMNVGSLVDESHPAFDYMRNTSRILTKERNILGVAAILHGKPILIPMHVKNGKWIGPQKEHF